MDHRRLAVSAALVAMLASPIAWAGPSTAHTPVSAATHQATTAGHHPKQRHGHRHRVIKVRVDPRMFGVHDDHWTSLSRPGTGAIRLWDSGTTWGLLYPTAGTPDWSRLDQVVSRAHADGTEVTLVLGLTPAFAAADSRNPAYPTTMPNLAMFRSYVTAVMSRYRDFDGYRGIAAYQVWNEANISTFWAGTPKQMARLVRTVYQVRNQVDPGATVVGPAMVTRLPYQQKGIKRFYAQRVGGRPVWTYVDAISLNLYPLDSYPAEGGPRPGTPEDSMALLATVRGLLAEDGVPDSLPIWNTEVNYGLHTGSLGGHAATPIPDALQVAYLMRTYLLNAAAGVKRVDWYAYDMGDQPAAYGGAPLGNTLLTDPSDRTAGVLTPAGRAFARVQRWMRGTLLGTRTQRPCATDRHGTYTCVVQYAHGVGRIYWNPYRRASVTLDPTARKMVDELGAVTEVTGRHRIRVGYAPVLVRSRY